MFVWKKKLKGDNNAAKLRQLLGKAAINIRDSESMENEHEADNYCQTYLKDMKIGSRIAVHYMDGEVGRWLVEWSSDLKMPTNLEEVVAINPDTPTKVWHRLRCADCGRPVSSGFEEQIFVIAAIICYDCVNASANG